MRDAFKEGYALLPPLDLRLQCSAACQHRRLRVRSRTHADRSETRPHPRCPLPLHTHLFVCLPGADRARRRHPGARLLGRVETERAAARALLAHLAAAPLRRCHHRTQLGLQV